MQKHFCYLCHSIIKMKALSLILSLYVLVLLAMPCADVSTDNAVHKNEIGNSTASHQHDHEGEVDHCSPFCLCNCCVSPVPCTVFAIDFSCTYVTQIQLCQYVYSEKTYNFIPIWQPPKLV